MTLHERKSPNHIVHAILTFLMPLWAAIWIMSCPRGPWRCQTCGSETGPDRSVSPIAMWIVAVLLLGTVAAFWVMYLDKALP